MQRVTYAHNLDYCYDLIPVDDAIYRVPPEVARIAQDIIHPDISFHWVSECEWPEVGPNGEVQPCGHTRMGNMRRCPYHEGQRIGGFWGACLKRPVYSHLFRPNGDVFRVYEWKPVYVGWLPPVPLSEAVLRQSRITYAGRLDAVTIWNSIKSDRAKYREYWREEYRHFTLENRREIQDDINLAMNTGCGRNAQISTFVQPSKRGANAN